MILSNDYKEQRASSQPQISIHFLQHRDNKRWRRKKLRLALYLQAIAALCEVCDCQEPQKTQQMIDLCVRESKHSAEPKISTTLTSYRSSIGSLFVETPLNRSSPTELPNDDWLWPFTWRSPFSSICNGRTLVKTFGTAQQKNLQITALPAAKNLRTIEKFQQKWTLKKLREKVRETAHSTFTYNVQCQRRVIIKHITQWKITKIRQ